MYWLFFTGSNINWKWFVPSNITYNNDNNIIIKTSKPSNLEFNIRLSSIMKKGSWFYCSIPTKKSCILLLNCAKNRGEQLTNVLIGTNSDSHHMIVMWSEWSSQWKPQLQHPSDTTLLVATKYTMGLALTCPKKKRQTRMWL